MNPGDFTTLDFLFDLVPEARCLIDPGKKEVRLPAFLEIKKGQRGLCVTVGRRRFYIPVN
jgi:hypothetical protein